VIITLDESPSIISSFNGGNVKIVLVVSDTCTEPSLKKSEGEIRVTIGSHHDFDNILDVTSQNLTNEEISDFHRLWADDTFPRNFNRVGDELIITARD
jgi:hypothetical protein